MIKKNSPIKKSLFSEKELNYNSNVYKRYLKIWFLLASLFLFFQYACYGKKKTKDFLIRSIWISAQTRETNVKRRFYNFRVTIRKKRCVKKITSVTGEKRRTEVCVRTSMGARPVNGQHYQERREREASNSGPLSVIRLCPQIAKLCTLETIAAWKRTDEYL